MLKYANRLDRGEKGALCLDPHVYEKVSKLLLESGIRLADGMEERFQAHLRWIRQWNAVGGFVSTAEVAHLEQHLWDSLGLAPYIDRAGRWLDIGPGGGFPAIPVAMVLPMVSLVMVDRSEKKGGLLLGGIRKLGLRELFHVEQLDDGWQAAGLRRGTVHRITAPSD